MATRGAFDKTLSQAPRKGKRRKKSYLLGKQQRKTRGPRVIRT